MSYRHIFILLHINQSLIVYVLIKNPTVYVVSQNRNTGVSYIEEVVSSEHYSYMDDQYTYCSKGFVIVAEMVSQYNIKRIVRKIYDVDTETSNVIIDEYGFNGRVIGKDTKEYLEINSNEILYFTIGERGCIYTPSNGKLFETSIPPYKFSVHNCGDFLIYSDWHEYFIFTKEFKLVKHEVKKCASLQTNCGVIVNDHKSGKSTFYADNEIIKNGIITLDKTVMFLTNESNDSSGKYF